MLESWFPANRYQTGIHNIPVRYGNILLVAGMCEEQSQYGV
jgi:hypothetical protein